MVPEAIDRSNHCRSPVMLMKGCGPNEWGKGRLSFRGSDSGPRGADGPVAYPPGSKARPFCPLTRKGDGAPPRHHAGPMPRFRRLTWVVMMS